MPAPANPTSVDQFIVGFILTGTGQASPAALISWNRPAPLPTPVEHYELTLNDPAKGSTVISTGDGATSALVHLAQLGGEVAGQYNGDETVVVRAVNTDGASSGANVPFLFFFGSGFLAQPSDNSDMAIADNVVATVISDTSISLSWDWISNTSNPAVTNLTHWRVRYQWGGGFVDFQDIPFSQTSVLIEGLTPGTTYAFQVCGIYYAKDIFGRADTGSATPELLSTEFKPEFPDLVTTTGSLGTITGPFELKIPVGANAAATFESSMGPVIGWSLIDGPPGISIESRGLPGAPFLGDLTGEPSEEGIFDAKVCARTRASATDSDHLITRDVHIICHGKTLLPWFHNLSGRTDIQLDIRDGSVRSFALNLATGIRLVRGDTVRVHFMVRNGRQMYTAAPVDKLSITARLVNNFASPPLLRFAQPVGEIFSSDAGPIETLWLDLAADNPILDKIFAGLNRSPGNEPGAREIPAELEIVLTLTGQKARTFGPVKLILAQDYDR